jgi:hypothetical protein
MRRRAASAAMSGAIPEVKTAMTKGEGQRTDEKRSAVEPGASDLTARETLASVSRGALVEVQEC